jgi:hypothetical protein
METKLFKKILNDIFLSGGFSKKGSYYYQEGEDCLCIIGIQKSNYSTGYYINVGFVLKKLNELSHKLKDRDGDVRTRLTYISDGRETDFFDLEKLTDSDEILIRENVMKCLGDIVEPALKPDGIRALLAQKPALLYQTKLVAKEFLGIKKS